MQRRRLQTPTSLRARRTTAAHGSSTGHARRARTAAHPPVTPRPRHSHTAKRTKPKSRTTPSAPTTHRPQAPRPSRTCSTSTPSTTAARTSSATTATSVWQTRRTCSRISPSASVSAPIASRINTTQVSPPTSIPPRSSVAPRPPLQPPATLSLWPSVSSARSAWARMTTCYTTAMTQQPPRTSPREGQSREPICIRLAPLWVRVASSMPIDTSHHLKVCIGIFVLV